MDQIKEHPSTAQDLYKEDFYRWSFEQASLLQEGRFAELDVQNLVDEIEDMAKSVRRALESSYRLVISHLIKMKYQPAHTSRSWIITIARERDNITDFEEENPSLAREIPGRIPRIFTRARKDAALETRIRIDALPDQCPFSIDEIRNDRFFPDEASEAVAALTSATNLE